MDSAVWMLELSKVGCKGWQRLFPKMGQLGPIKPPFIILFKKKKKKITNNFDLGWSENFRYLNKMLTDLIRSFLGRKYVKFLLMLFLGPFQNWRPNPKVCSVVKDHGFPYLKLCDTSQSVFSSAVWMLELSEVGCKDWQRFWER